MEWKSLSKEEAMRSPYYGLKGWLLVFYVLTALGIVPYLGLMISPPTSGSGDVGMTRVFLLIHVTLSVPFLILAPMKHPLMPKVVIICLWMSFASRASPMYPAALASASGTATYLSSVNLFGVIGAGVVAVLITWYMLRSKRVNVTYLNRVPA